MEAYQVRMMKEYTELVDRYMKLNTMLKKYDSGALEFDLNCPVELLKEQSDVMWRYIEILYERADYENVELEPCAEGAAFIS